MPYSAGSFDDQIAALLPDLRPTTALDIGPGAGKYGRMLRSLGLPSGRLEAIELDRGYIDDFGLLDVYNEVHVGDAGDIPDLWPDRAWDLVIIGDVLEHLRRSRGLDLLDFLYYRTKYVMLAIPIDYIQGAWEGHAQEAHISTWYPEDFSRYRATCLRSPSGPDSILVLFNGLRTVPGEDFLFSSLAPPK